jgi:hypothetical protein
MAREGLEVSDREPVTIGGLDGLLVDLSLADGYTGTCPFAEGVPVVPILIGLGPAGLHHVLGDAFDMRLDVLAGPPNTPIAIEVIDVPGRQSIDDLSAVVEQMSFGE